MTVGSAWRGERRPVRLATVDALSTPEGLALVLDGAEVEGVRRVPLSTAGKSGASLERLVVRLHTGETLGLVLKRADLRREVVARHTGDVFGREAALLAEPALAGVWQAFACPYRAYAAHNGEVGLLMDDLSAYLVSVDEEPITESQEDASLAALAALHARFWNAPALGLPWLLAPAKAIDIFSLRTAERELTQAPSEIYEWIRQGWAALARHTPATVAALLARPQEAFGRVCAGLPRTLLHLDARLVNFALLPGGRVAAFDWQLVGAGPATLDLGFYLIGNARRRARPPEAVLARYRGLLEAELGTPLSAWLWERMVAAGVLFGAATLMWDRALDLEDDLPGAAAEFDWWVRQLEACTFT